MADRLKILEDPLRSREALWSGMVPRAGALLLVGAIGCGGPRVEVDHHPLSDGRVHSREECRGAESPSDPLAVFVKPAKGSLVGHLTAAEQKAFSQFGSTHHHAPPAEKRSMLAVMLRATERGAFAQGTFLVAVGQGELGLFVHARANAHLAAEQALAASPPRPELADAARREAARSAEHVASLRFDLAGMGPDASAWLDGRFLWDGASIEVVAGTYHLAMFRQGVCVQTPLSAKGKDRIRIQFASTIEVAPDTP